MKSVEDFLKIGKEQSKLTRICVSYPIAYEKTDKIDLFCLFRLKHLIKKYDAVILLIIPSCLDLYLKNYVLMISDFYMKFEPFKLLSVDNCNEALYKEYNGSVQFLKVLNHSSFKMQYKIVDLVYKFRRKNLVIEKGCLLPDLSETASRSEKRPELLKSKPKKTSELF